MATTLTEKEQKFTIRNKRKQRKTVKYTLLKPSNHDWVKLSPEFEAVIKTKIKETFNNLARIKLRYPKGKEKVKNKEKALKERDGALTEDQINIRSQLVLGLNAVTRHLEKNQLRLVLVDGNTRPLTLTNHVLELSLHHNCTCVAVSDLAGLLRPLFNVSSVISMGIKRVTEDKDPLAEFVETFSACSNVTITTSIPAAAAESSEDEEEFGEETTEPENPDQIDYQHLYIYKKDLAADAGFESQHFIAFSQDSSDEETTVTHRRAGKRKHPPQRTAKYIQAQIARFEENTERKSTKKRKKGKWESR